MNSTPGGSIPIALLALLLTFQQCTVRGDVLHNGTNCPGTVPQDGTVSYTFEKATAGDYPTLSVVKTNGTYGWHDRLPLGIVGGDIQTGGVRGIPEAPYVLLSTTNILRSRAEWEPVTAGYLDQWGAFDFTTSFNETEPQRYFLLKAR